MTIITIIILVFVVFVAFVVFIVFISITPQVKSSLSREGVLTITAPRGNPVAAQSYTQTLENKMDKVRFSK